MTEKPENWSIMRLTDYMTLGKTDSEDVRLHMIRVS